MKLSEILFNSVEHIWNSYLTHPFITKMADGTLEIEKFKYYMLQDYVYLKDYIKVFAVGSTKSNEFDEIKFFCDNMYAVLDETYKVHIPYMKRLGITEKDIMNVTPHIDNTSYTKYMLYEGQNGDMLSCLIAILSCSWSYAFISKKIVEKNKSCLENETYGEWFNGYYCKEYQETNEKLIQKVDNLSNNLSQKTIDKLTEIFVNCSIYEAKFWDLAYDSKNYLN